MMKLQNIKTISLVTLTSVALASVIWMQLTSSSAVEASSGRSVARKVWPAQVQKEFNAEAKRSFVAEKEARQLLKERRFNEAEKACYRALALCPKVNGDPINIAAQRLLGDVYQAQGRYKEAIEAYQTSCKYTFKNDNEEVELKISLCYLRMGDMENAHKFYTEEKFYSVERFLGGTTAKQKADDFSMLPGDKTPRTMEASLLYTLGAEIHGYPEEANDLFKKTLELAPHNALAARQIAWNLDFLGKGDEAVSYWARAAVFGKGYIADEGHRELNNHLMPDKIEQALRDARKIS